jgi:hypothetical protein
MNNKDLTADIIKICAVITAMPRWVGALLAAEGIMIPEQWRGWWIVASAIFNAAMAVTEGLAFAYVFNAWRNQKDKNADRLLWLAIASGATFVVVLAPFIAAQVRSVTLAAMLSADWALWAWSASVAASTIIIVASVGYAQKRSMPQSEAQKPARATIESKAISLEPVQASLMQPLELAQIALICDGCEREFATKQALSAHKRFCARMINVDAGRPALDKLALPATNGNGSVTQ